MNRITTSNVTDIAKRVTDMSGVPPPRPLGGGSSGIPPKSTPATRASVGAGPTSTALSAKRAPSSSAAVAAAGDNKPLTRRSPSSGGGGLPPATTKRSPSSSNANNGPSSSSVHHPKMSTAKLDPNRFANPFATDTKKCKTSFSSSYVNGSIPCRLQTSASRYFLQWEKGAETGFSPDLLIVCADGLIETDHPYVVLAPMMFAELCHRSEGCADLFSPHTVETVAAHIRTALMASAATGSVAAGKAVSAGGAGCGSGSSLFEGALNALSVFLQNTGNLMLPYLAKYIIPALARPYSAEKGKRDAIAEVLRLMEQQCGPEATKIIKSKIPTY